MENLVFRNYKMEQILRISNLSTAHYLSDISNYRTPPHRHEAWELVVCLKGRVRTFQGEQHQPLKSGQLILVPPNAEHWLWVDQGKATLIIIAFSCYDQCLKLLQHRVLEADRAQRQILQIIVDEMGSAFKLVDGKLLLVSFHQSENSPLGAEQMITCYMEAFLINLLREATGRGSKAWKPELLEQAMENRIAADIQSYVDAHLTQKLSMETIAAGVHYSRSYIAAQFRRSTGTTISSYVSKRRLEEAERLLKSGEYTISQIAEQLNYSSVQYFSKCFKDAYGICPSAYEKKSI